MELAYVTLVFLLGGVVKGVIAFGLPIVTVPLLSLVMPVPEAIAVALVSVFASSVVQAYLCRRDWRVLGRVWPLCLGVAAAIPFSARFAGGIDPRTLNLVIGVAIEAMVAIQWRGVRASLPERRRTPVLLAGGVLSGLVGGVTSFYSFPSVQLMVAMGLTANEFAFATSAMFTGGSLSLGLSLGSVYTERQLVPALWGLVPLTVGMIAGQRLRGRIPVETFRRLVLLMLVVSGASLIRRGLM